MSLWLFLVVNVFVFLGGNYFKIANLGYRTYCNTFWIIFGTSKKRTKYRFSDFSFITRILQKKRKNMHTFHKRNSVNLDSKNCIFWKIVCKHSWTCKFKNKHKHGKNKKMNAIICSKHEQCKMPKYKMETEIKQLQNNKTLFILK